jgi:hypothetical protein
MGYPPNADALIQNKRHRGYRLNPDIRFIAFDEIESGARMSRNH